MRDSDGGGEDGDVASERLHRDQPEALVVGRHHDGVGGVHHAGHLTGVDAVAGEQFRAKHVRQLPRAVIPLDRSRAHSWEQQVAATRVEPEGRTRIGAGCRLEAIEVGTGGKHSVCAGAPRQGRPLALGTEQSQRCGRDQVKAAHEPAGQEAGQRVADVGAVEGDHEGPRAGQLRAPARQAEVGVKYERQILLTADVFRMRQPFFYPRAIMATDSFCTGAITPGDLCFESAGHETHDGIELNAQGKATSWLQMTASLEAMRAISSDTGTLAFDGKQVINVPRLHSAVFADMLLPHLRGLHLTPGWSYTSRKEATRDDQVSVAGYNLFNLGARYTPRGENGRMTLRLYADNLFDKRYWKDTGASYGDTYIHLGAPTTVRLSAHYTF